MSENSSNEKTFIQLAGHITFSERKIPCIIPNSEKDNKTIFKLIQPPPKGQIEFIFYRHKHLYMSRYVEKEEKIKNDETVNIDSSYPNVSCNFSDSGLSDWSTQNSTNVSISQSDSNNGLIQTSSKSSKNSYHQQYCRFDDLKINQSSLKKFLFNFTPKFHGIKTINGYDYLELENLYNTFPDPCLADVKIGKQTFDPLADEEKRKRRMAKWPPLQTLGYQFLGIQRGVEGQHLDRSWCRSLKLEEIFTAFRRFLPDVTKNTDTKILEKIQTDFTNSINEITTWTESQNTIQLYATSLFMCYCNQTGRIKIKLIDFAHIFFEEGRRDENFIEGIKNFTRDLNLACEGIIKEVEELRL